MRKILFLLVAIACLVEPDSGLAQEKEPNIEALTELSKRLSSFYTNPTEADFKQINQDIIHFDADLKKLENKSNISMTTSTFLARVHGKYGYPIEGDTLIIQFAHQIADSETDDRVAKFINDDQEVTPAKLDLWWVSFFATGDEKYLRLLLAQAGVSKQDGKDINALLIRGAASWSFMANCNQHEKVLEFAKEALTKAEWEEKHEFIRECIDAVMKKSDNVEKEED